MDRKKLQNPFWLFMLWVLGTAVYVTLIFSSNSPKTMTNIVTAVVFLLIVAIIFFYAFIGMRRGVEISNDLIQAADAIASRKDNKIALNQKDAFENNGFLHYSALVDAFEDYKKDSNRMNEITPGNKVQISDFINCAILDKKIKKHFLNQIAGVMTGLGILGTFIGLSIGLNSFDLSGQAIEVEQKIQPLMEGIKVAFHTSIVGMIYSLGFNFFYRGYLAKTKNAVDHYLSLFEKYIVPINEIGAAGTIIDNQNHQLQLQKDSISNQKEVQQIVEELKGDIVFQIGSIMKELIVPEMQKMGKAFETFAEETQKDQRDSIRLIVDNFISEMHSALGDSFKELGSVIADTNEWQKKSLEQMSNVLNTVGTLTTDLAVINKNLENSIEKITVFVNSTTEAQKTTTENLVSLNEVTVINQRLLEMQSQTVEKIQENEEKMCTSVRLLTEQHAFQVELLQKQNEEITGSLQKELLQFSTNAADIAKNVSDEVQKQMKMTTESVIVGQETVRDQFMEVQEEIRQKLETLKNFTEHYNSDVTEVSKNLNSAAEKLAASMETGVSEFGFMFEKIKTIQENLVELNGSMTKSGSDMEGHLKQISQLNAQIVETQRMETVTLDNISKQAMTSGELMMVQKNSLNEIMEKEFELVNNMNEVSGYIGSQIHDIKSVIDSCSKEISFVSSQLNDSARKLGTQMDNRTKETFATFDHELSRIVNHLSGTLLQMNQTLKKVPMTVNDVYGDMDDKFKEMQILLDQYLEYADKLHHNIELKWNQLRIEERERR